MRRVVATLIILCAVYTLAPPAAQGAAFVNGSFEMPGGLPPNSFLLLPPGDTTLVGWTIGGSGGVVGYINGLLDFNPVDGTYHLNFNGGDEAPGTFLTQSFDTLAGQQYLATFIVGRDGTDGTDGDIVSLTASALSAGDDILGSLQAFPPDHGYGAVQSLPFTATSATTTLRFTDTSLDTVSVDVLLDNIAVVPADADFNGDGRVDGADLAAWSANFGLASGATKSQGDADVNGDVDGGDFLAWQRMLGARSAIAPAAAAAPEPGALALAATSLLGVLMSARRSRRG